MFGKYYSIGFYLLLFSLIHVHAQGEYRYPLDLNPDLSGGFGDLRKNHFHTGLDLRTGGAIGAPVYAIADGWIYRLKLSPYGFGKAVYIKHENGYISVYGHLDKFAPQLQDSVFARQKSYKANSVDWYLPEKAICVKKGERIAWSGNSGQSGGPHLHFEIREDEEHILNPMKFYKHIFKDTYPPKIEKIAFAPLSPKAYIKGSKRKLVLTPIGSNGNYNLKDTVFFSGIIGMEYLVSDHLRPGGFKIQIYTSELWIDDSLHFRYVMDKFGFEQKRYVNAHMDYAHFHTHDEKIQRSYLCDGNRLNAYSFRDSGGRIHLKDSKPHTFRLIVRDYHGNKSEVSGWLRSSTQPPHDSHLVKENTGTIPKVIWELSDHFIYLNIYPADKKSLEGLQVHLENGDIIPLTPYHIQADEASFVWEIKAPFPVKIQNADKSIQRLFHFKSLLYPEQQNIYTHGNLEIHMAPETLLDTFALEIKESPSQWNSWSQHYTIGRKDIPLMKAIELTIQATRPIADSSCIYLARCEGNDRKWMEEQSLTEYGFSAQTTEWGTYCLACDKSNPKIGSMNFKNEQNISSLKTLTFVANDTGSGIDDNQTSVYVNGVWTPVLWDSRVQKFNLDIQYLPKGKLQLWIQLKDKTGNQSEYSYTLMH